MEVTLKEETFAKETFTISRLLPKSRKKLDPAKHSIRQSLFPRNILKLVTRES